MTDARVLHRLALVAILAGLAFSVYAAFEVLNPALQGSCTVNGYLSCAKVDQSAWTTIGPVPDWAVGVGGFALMLAIDVPLLRSYDPRLLRLLLGVSVAGLAVAAGLAYVELAIIQALCPICLGAYFSDAAVVGLVVGIDRLRRRPEPIAEEAPGGSSVPAR